MVDDDTDPYNQVQEWWNSNGLSYLTPREHLFEQLGLAGNREVAKRAGVKVGKGSAFWLRENPATLTASAEGGVRLIQSVKQVAALSKLKWRKTNYLQLRRGPYLIAAGLDESIVAEAWALRGR